MHKLSLLFAILIIACRGNQVEINTDTKKSIFQIIDKSIMHEFVEYNRQKYDLKLEYSKGDITYTSNRNGLEVLTRNKIVWRLILSQINIENSLKLPWGASSLTSLKKKLEGCPMVESGPEHDKWITYLKSGYYVTFIYNMNNLQRVMVDRNKRNYLR